MKTLFYLSFVLLSLLTAKGQDSHTAPLTAIVQKISNSWQDVDLANKTDIKLESITASFTASKTITSGAELKIWIFKLGKKIDRTYLNKITIELQRGDESKRVSKGSEQNNDLTKFINAALNNFKVSRRQKIIT